MTNWLTNNHDGLKNAVTRSITHTERVHVDNARKVHNLDGGYLIKDAWHNPYCRNHCVVCYWVVSHEEALDMGYSADFLRSLEPTFDETRPCMPT